MVHLTLDGRLGKHLGGLLEGGGGQEGLGGQRGLGDTHEQTGAGGQTQLLAHLVLLAGSDAVLDRLLGIQELDDVDGGTGQQVGIAGVLHTDLPHHLADNNLDVLIVGVNALLTVHLLHLSNQVIVTIRQTADA